MKNIAFRALVVEEKDGNFTRSIKTRHIKDLPAGDLLIKVQYSSLNYKDGLSAIGNKGVTKNYPHTPGIDAVGVVVHSDSYLFVTGDSVIVTGNDLGMNTDGGFAEYIRVPVEWAVVLPDSLTPYAAMTIGTAGLTAGALVRKIIAGVKPEDGEILVSGATGGVGSVSVALLAELGYKVVCVTGKESEHDLLKSLGATEIISRAELQEATTRPMLKGRWAGAIDTVGGLMLENIIKSIQPYGVVSCCGNVAGAELNLTVFPFILRGVTLAGVSSQNLPLYERIDLWKKFATDWNLDIFEKLSEEVELDEINIAIDKILKGQSKGRIVVHI